MDGGLGAGLCGVCVAAEEAGGNSEGEGEVEGSECTYGPSGSC